MDKLKLSVVISIVLMIVTGLLYLNFSKIKKSDHLYHGKITIGYAPWPGYLALIVAKDKGYFKQAGLDVDIKNYPSLGELSKDYVAGKIQGRANLTLEAIKEYLNGLDQRIVVVIDYSNGSDAILARKGIETVKDFKDKKVAYEFGTLEEFFLTWALNENGLNISDITPINASPEESAKQLQEGKVDVGVSYEPFISTLVDSGDFHKIYSSAQTPGLITDILTFRKDFIDASPQTIQTIVNVYFKAIKFWKDNPDEVNAILAKEFGGTPQEIEKQLKGVKVLDQQENQIAFTFAAGFQSIYGNMRQIGSFVKKHQGIVDRHINTDKLISDRFIEHGNE